jgi:hypothetical protein
LDQLVFCSSAFVWLSYNFYFIYTP